jgi:hypothetical protein
MSRKRRSNGLSSNIAVAPALWSIAYSAASAISADRHGFSIQKAIRG